MAPLINLMEFLPISIDFICPRDCPKRQKDGVLLGPPCVSVHAGFQLQLLGNLNTMRRFQRVA